MNEKSGLSAKKTKKTMKHWVAVILFGAIIIVFGLWGVNPSRMGGGDASNGGVAATVNDVSISLAEYRSRVESVEQNMKGRFDQFPESQRKALSHEMRRRALEELILGELVYQAASGRGVVAPDAEVRDYILKIPFLQENGRFLKDRYKMFLQNMNLTTDDFERQVRKQIVGQKLQELFLGSAAPTREELKLARQLGSQKLSLRFVEIKPEDLQKPAFVSEQDVTAYKRSNHADIEKYYKDNGVEFNKPEKIQARHILIRVDEKRPDAEAAKMAAALKTQATAQNFSALALKNSDDPGSKVKGGDLGEFERGRMVPEFEKAAFALAPGQISAPVKTSFGYHIILVDKKIPAAVVPLEKAEGEIARKLFVRNKESEILAKTKTLLEKGAKPEINNLVQSAGLKWVDSGEFDLASPGVPKLGDSKDVFRAILKNGQTPGLIHQLISSQGRHFIVDVISWKDVPEKASAPEAGETPSRSLASRKSADLIEAWSKEIEAKANVQRNARILQ